MKNSKLLLISIFLLLSLDMFSQASPDYNGGIKIKFNDNGSDYLRIISWVQFQTIYIDDVPDDESNINFNLRRARVYLLSQFANKFLIVAHFGLNNLNSSQLNPTGRGDGSQLFFHDFWGQWDLTEDLSIGAGLHYWNGISRLNSQSTLNLLTLDNNRQSWSTLGLSDQVGRHVGVFLKGKFNKFKYRLAINEAITNGLDERTPELDASAVYGGKRILGSKDAGFAYAGYFEYHIKDQESILLPTKVGTYLGTKSILNVGAGFFAHPKGSVRMDNTGELVGENVSLFAVDVFYDSPLGKSGSALTAYATYQSNDYGKNYLFLAYGTGSMLYGHIGFVLPGAIKKPRIQPYLSYGNSSYDAVSANRGVFGAGANLYLNGNNSKLTLEYKNQNFTGKPISTVTLQAMIYL